MFSMLNFTFNFPTRLQFLSLYLHVFVKITIGDACMLHVWIVIQCCNLLCVGFTMNSAYGRMACYTCMDHASQDNWPGHPIVCMLGAFNLLQIRRTHKNINSSCLGAAMCRTQEVVSKLGDKMVWNSTAQPQGLSNTTNCRGQKIHGIPQAMMGPQHIVSISTPYAAVC